MQVWKITTLFYCKNKSVVFISIKHTDNPSVKESLQMHLNVAFHVMQVSDSFTDVPRVGSQCVVVVR